MAVILIGINFIIHDKILLPTILTHFTQQTFQTICNNQKFLILDILIR